MRHEAQHVEPRRGSWLSLDKAIHPLAHSSPRTGCSLQVAAFGCLISLSFIRNEPKNLNKRYGCLAAFSFCQGAALGPLVGYAVALHPATLVTAFLGTCAVFGSFSLSALITQRR